MGWDSLDRIKLRMNDESRRSGDLKKGAEIGEGENHVIGGQRKRMMA